MNFPEEPNYPAPAAFHLEFEQIRDRAGILGMAVVAVPDVRPHFSPAVCFEHLLPDILHKPEKRRSEPEECQQDA